MAGSQGKPPGPPQESHSKRTAASVSFATCDFCDAHKNDSPGRFRVLPPVFKNFGSVYKFCGPVVTVKCFEDNSLVKAAAKNGWAGVLIDGCVRDVAEPAQFPFGMCALAAMPWPTEKRKEGQQGVAIQIQGVWVYPGDWLYADEDGVVVMPSAGQA
ncbi:ribonuclease [Polaromonas sp. UC242_47]|uniref:RraA family protein n=1 Tax=Polaromonas sp. UC242_47 TaxID=3374626 RepID=UPI0037ACED63